LAKGDRMAFPGSQKPNSLAIAGFLAPFVAAGIIGLLLLSLGEDLDPFKVSIAYLTITPLILLTGTVLSLKSISLVQELGDKDYAYSGLILNILFLIVYVTSLTYFFPRLISPP